MIKQAIRACELETVQALLRHNNESIQPTHRGACLLIAVEQDDLYLMIEILLDGEIPESALSLALQKTALYGQTDLFLELLAQNNFFSAEDLGKALLTAAQHGHADILKELSNHPRLFNTDLNKALEITVQLGNVEGTKALLADNTAFSEQDLKAALQKAQQAEGQEIVSCLIDALHEHSLNADPQKKQKT